jgi:hypothetical protein
MPQERRGPVFCLLLGKQGRGSEQKEASIGIVTLDDPMIA